MMAPSRIVTSRQEGPHPRLVETVLKHRDHEWKKPISDHSQRAFDQISVWAREWGGPLILDTGCGTGYSTSRLAQRFQTHLVVGIDKSEARLDRRQGDTPHNARWIRADLADVWILAERAKMVFDRQYFFYPNPWPKPEQRLRRWPFHPVFPVALQCGGDWELRTNWKIYAQEFDLALKCLGVETSGVELWQPSEPDTLFERKYSASGHQLWRCLASTPGGSKPLPARPILH